MFKKMSKITRFSLVMTLAIIFAGIFLAIDLLYLGNDSYYADLNGEEKITIGYGDTYDDAGFKFYQNGKEVEQSSYTFEVSNNVDTSVLGTYSVKYDISYKNSNYSLERTVEVKDLTKPIIESEISSYEVYECNINDEIKIDYTAKDNYDGDITDKVVVTRNENNILLSVTDSSNNSAELSIPIVSVANPSPSISLNGTSTVYFKVGSEYQEYGYELKSVCNGSITDNVKITSNVDMTKEGEYTVTYTSGNNKVSRKVIVFSSVASISNAQKNGKVVYLTFDDGPGPYTDKLLEILKEYDVKATFFVTNQFPNYQYDIAKEYQEGHTVAVHTLTHKWTVYKSVATYVDDFNKMNNIIYAQTGTYSKLFRFPGGSSNTVSKNYAKGVVSAIASKMSAGGYVYFDWNVDSGDAAGASTNKIISNVTTGISKHSTSVVLMHDIKKTTLNAIESIIIYGLKNGYTFEALDENSYTAHHSIRN